MKKLLLCLLLAAGALLLGLFLPGAVTAIQTKNAAQSEEVGIIKPDLNIASNLSLPDKLSILASEDCAVLNVGVTQNQTPASLSQHSWALLEILSRDYGAALLDASTAQQVEQFALMASSGDRVFLFWEVLFTDGSGNLLRLHLDDETGLPLGLSYQSSNPKLPPEELCVTALYAMGDRCGLSPADPMLIESEDSFYVLSVTDGVQQCRVTVRLGDGYFLIGDQSY